MLKNNTDLQPPNLIILLKYLFFSIIAIHLLGLFGIFFAFTYLFIWLFGPNRTFCFYCFHVSLVKKDKGYCPICERNTITIYGPPLKSALINTGFIFFLSLTGFLLVFSEIKLAGQANINYSRLFIRQQANFVLPEKYQFTLEKEFDFDVEVRNPEKPVNVVQADIQFDKDLVNVDSIQTNESFATIFTQKDFSNDKGWIRIVGGLPNPGFIGEKGLFARVIFKPVKSGVGRIIFLPTSKILANDGRGSNLLARFPSQSFLIESGKKVLGVETNLNIWKRFNNYLSSIFF